MADADRRRAGPLADTDAQVMCAHSRKPLQKNDLGRAVCPVGLETLVLYAKAGRERPSAFWWRAIP
jgi:hypothetical protein